MNRGFTLIELLVSIAIFVFMTLLVVVKYGSFNQSTLLTDTAYDIALSLRTAQTYGLSVKNINASFNVPYGISFNTSATGNGCATPTSATALVLYADTSEGSAATTDVYDCADTPVNSYLITRGATIGGLCVGDGSSCTYSGLSQLDVTFTRPYPEAVICANGSSASCPYTYAAITLLGSDGSTRTITVRGNGQVSVEQ